MTCLEIIKAYLKANGYDGLCNPEEGIECGCGLATGLAPCECMNMETCVPAYRVDDIYKPTKEGE